MCATASLSVYFRREPLTTSASGPGRGCGLVDIRAVRIAISLTLQEPTISTNDLSVVVSCQSGKGRR